MSARRLRLAGLVAASLLWAALSEADVVYPARLILEEVEPGAYDVAFTLPILEGRKLRAEPILPPTCRDVGERVVDASPTSFETRWRVACEPASLAGEAIVIQGLLGTQTELRVEIGTLDGRKHTALLKPSRPGLIVPPPPGIARLVAVPMVEGMRRVLRAPELWVLALVGAFAGVGRRSAALGVLGFASGQAAAQWLATRNGLLVSGHFAPAFALLVALPTALGLANGDGDRSFWFRPTWFLGVLLGGLLGGVRPDPLATEGLSTSEQILVPLVSALGVAIGLGLLVAIAAETRWLGNRFVPEAWRRRVGSALGIASVGLLVPRVFALFLLPTDLPRAPLELGLFAVLLGAALPALGVSERGAPPLGMALFLAAGLTLGFVAGDPPLGRVVVLGSLFLFGLLLLRARRAPVALVLALAALALVVHGWSVGRVLDENVSLPVATAAGAGLVAVELFFATLRIAQRLPLGEHLLAARALGVAVASLALVWRLGEYLLWLDGQVATEAALGLVRVPLLALALLGLAAVFWPRRRRVLRELGVERRAAPVHWVLVGLAFFFLPVGTLAARNPAFEPEAPRGDDARRIVTQVLWNTYHAFNIDDEDELYDRLSENVTGDLVEDLYLDSRRRLTAGTREGAEVTVRDVSVIDVEDEVAGTAPESGFGYDCQWIVTARVRHLQHVHHRQNIYRGRLVIRAEGERWKIASVELTSEDRVVLPWNPS